MEPARECTARHGVHRLLVLVMTASPRRSVAAVSAGAGLEIRECSLNAGQPRPAAPRPAVRARPEGEDPKAGPEGPKPKDRRPQRDVMTNAHSAL